MKKIDRVTEERDDANSFARFMFIFVVLFGSAMVALAVFANHKDTELKSTIVEKNQVEAILDTAQQCVNFPVGVDVPDGLDYSGTGEWSFEGVTVGHAEFEDEAFYICSDVATIGKIMNNGN